MYSNDKQKEYWTNSAGKLWVKDKLEKDNMLEPLGNYALSKFIVSKGSNIIDIGCGTGHTSVQLSNMVGKHGHIDGFDLSQTMIDEALKYSNSLEKKNINEKINVKQSTFFLLSKIIFCVIGLIFGANFLIDGSVQIAQYYKVSERVIGLSLIAIGTSLPELITAIMASIKRSHGIALGTVLGANMYNILVLLSIVEIIQPSSIVKNIQSIDIFVLGVSSLFLFLFIVLFCVILAFIGYIVKPSNTIHSFFCLFVYDIPIKIKA